MKHGALAVIPLALGAAAYGLAFGVLAGQFGFPWWGVATMSGLVHAGSSQIVAIEQFASGSSILGAALAGAALNLRYLGIIASLTEMLRPLPLWRRLIAIHLTGDENWALTMAERVRNPGTGAGFLLGSGAVMITVWTLSTTLGALIGAALPNLASLGLGFAFTAAFIAMARGVWRRGVDLAPWGVSFAITLAAASAGLPTAFAIVIGVASAMLVLAVRRQVRERGR